MGLHESIMKKIHSDSLNERAELNTKRIEYMELNELLAALREEIEEDINYNLEFFRVITGYEDGKAYIDIESKDSDDIAFFEGAFSVDDILDMTERDMREYRLPKEDVDAIKGQILIERDKLMKRIIPDIARKWGFRNIRNSTTENIDSMNESTRRDFDNNITDAADNIIWAHFDDESAEETVQKSPKERARIAFDYMRTVEVPWLLDDMADENDWPDLADVTVKELADLADFAPELKNEINIEIGKIM